MDCDIFDRVDAEDGAEAEEKTVFTFAELSRQAKQRARDEWRRCEDGDTSWTEFIMEDVETIAKMIGLEFKQRSYRTVGGKTRYEPCIYWSLYTQGSGACFEGTFRTKQGCYLAVKEHAPQDDTLHDIALRLAMAEWPGPYELAVTITQHGNDTHEHSMSFEGENTESGEELTAGEAAAVNKIEEALVDFARWIHGQIEDEDMARNADSYIDERLSEGDYEFDEDGAFL